MKQLKLDQSINVGGHRRSVDDLLYLQDSILDVAQALALMHGNSGSTAILSELEIEDLGATYNLNKPAVVYHDGKLYRVESVFGAAKGGVGSAFKFEMTTTVGANDPVEYENGSLFNVHIDETLQLRHTNAVGPQYIELSAAQASAWISFPTTPTNITVIGVGEYCVVKYRVLGKTLFVYVSINGQLTANTFSVPLPNAYKSKNFVRLPVAMYSNLDGVVGAKQFNTFFAIAEGFGAMIFQNGGTVYDLPEYDNGAINFATTFVVEIE